MLIIINIEFMKSYETYMRIIKNHLRKLNKLRKILYECIKRSTLTHENKINAINKNDL